MIAREEPGTPGGDNPGHGGGNIRDMGIYPELDNLSLEELIARFNGPNLGHEFVYYGEVAVRIRSKGEAGNAFLLKSLKEINDDDEERLRAILVALSFRTSEKENIHAFTRYYRYWLRDRLLSYLQDERPLIVKQAVHGLWRLKAKRAVDRIFELRNHESALVRESVLRYLYDLYPGRAYPILLESLHDSDWMVRSEAADLLGLSENWIEAIPFLHPLLDDPNEIVRDSAKQAIENLEFWASLARI